jgi:hypothetical protein
LSEIDKLSLLDLKKKPSKANEQKNPANKFGIVFKKNIPNSGKFFFNSIL